MSLNNKIPSLLIAICWNTAVLAQVWVNPSFKQYTTLDGLSQNIVKCLLADNNGYVWLGTQNGLNRYNGYTFEWKSFRHVIGDSTSISDNFITALHEDGSGNIWVASGKNKLDCYNTTTHRFQRFLLPYESTIQKTSHIFQLKDSNSFLLATTQNGLFLWNQNTNSLESIAVFKDIEINEILLSDNQIYIASSEGLFTLSNDGRNPLPDILPVHSGAIGGIALQQGSLIFTCKGEIITYNLSTHRKEVLEKNIRTSFGQLITLANTPLLWLVSNENELYFFNQETQELKKYLHQSSLSNLPPTISCVLQDNIGQIWLGTIGGGVFLCNNQAVGFHNFLENNKVWVLNFDQDSNLWVGGSQGMGLYQLRQNSENGWSVTKHFDSNRVDEWTPVQHQYFSDPDVYEIIPSKRGGLWIGAENSLHYYDRKKNKLEGFRYNASDTAKRGDNKFWCLYEDKDTVLWAGTYNGLKRFEWQTKSFKTYRHSPKDSASIGANMIWDILPETDRYLWLGTRHGGLNRFDKENETFERFLYNPYDENSLSMNTISDIIHDEEGNLWVATYGGGLNYFNLQNQQITRYGPNEGLIDEGLLALLLEDEYLWISTDLHLIRLHTKEGKFEYFDINDGTLPEYNLGAAVKDNRGNLYFGGINGFTAFASHQIGEKLEISIELSHLEIHQSDDFSATSLENTLYSFTRQTIPLAYNRNHLAVRWRKVKNNLSSQAYEVYYRLNAKDDWQKANANRNVLYLPNLEAGSYQLEIKLVEMRGFTESNTIVQPLVVENPPIYLQEWFQIGIIIFFTVMLGFYLYRQQSQKKLRHEQQKVQKLKTEQALVEKEQVLTAIQSRFAYTYHLYPNLMNTLLHHIRNGEEKNAEKLIYELRDVFLAVTQKEVCWTLKEEMQLVENYLTLEQKRFDKLTVDYHYIDPEVEKIATPVPVGIVLEFIYNAVKYAFDGKIDLWCISIEIGLQEEAFILIITDNGRGIAATQKGKGAKERKGTGQGIRVLKKWVSVANNLNEKKCTIDYTLSESRNEDFPGTKVTIRIPYQFNFLIDKKKSITTPIHKTT